LASLYLRDRLTAVGGQNWWWEGEVIRDKISIGKSLA